tara:strand:+ start:368 stop:910 length:543 start_codon:yes stop_codon:yes gene_type:complete
MRTSKRTFKQSITEGFSYNQFKKNLLKSTLIAAVFATIYASSFLFLGEFLNLKTIASELGRSAAINTSNILVIGAYIILINSLLEEFFWRGFVFKELSAVTSLWLAHLISGIAFALHHVMFYYNWFNPAWVVLFSVALTLFTLFMNTIVKKYRDLYTCWYIHAIVDVVQIGIALKVFNML